MHIEYSKGDTVTVELPGGKFTGKVREVLHNYGFVGNQETKYKITGKDFVTITSARLMNKVEDQQELF